MSRSGLRVFGHPVHPMVAGFPVAFWVGASGWDVMTLLRPETFWPQLAFWTLLVGTAAALPAVLSGFWDLVTLPPEHPAQRIAWWHMGIMTSVFCLESASLLLRRGDLGTAAPSTFAVGLAMTGAVLCLVGGWLGGELVFRHGLAVSTASHSEQEKEQG